MGLNYSPESLRQECIAEIEKMRKVYEEGEKEGLS
jgi:hypothetical protein